MATPERLKINNRPLDQDFTPDCLLYRGYVTKDWDFDQDSIKLETLRFPDLSCNWNRYSEPADVRYRMNGASTDGCYSISVSVASYEDMARPVHDPIDDDPEFENYSHVEVRVVKSSLQEGTSLPRKKKFSKSRKMKYRQHIVNNLIVEIEAESTD